MFVNMCTVKDYTYIYLGLCTVVSRVEVQHNEAIVLAVKGSTP